MAREAQREDDTFEGELVATDSMVALLNKSEIDQQITTAKQYPRSVKRFRDEAFELATLDEHVAEECMYAVPRDGKTIEGPSARFAEIIASAWGNCRFGSRVVAEDQEFVTAQGAFHDLEKNVAISYEVKRRIVNKHGKRFSVDMIGVTGNAACSIALRNAVLKGIPKALWSSIYQAARRTAVGNAQTMVAKRDTMIAYFAKMGVRPDRILAVLGIQGIEDIGLDELATLKGMATAIKEGDTTVDQAFAPTKPVVETATVSRETKPSETPYQGKAGTLVTSAPTADPGTGAHSVRAEIQELALAVAGGDVDAVERTISAVRKALKIKPDDDSDESMVRLRGALQDMHDLPPRN